MTRVGKSTSLSTSRIPQPAGVSSVPRNSEHVGLRAASWHFRKICRIHHLTLAPPPAPPPLTWVGELRDRNASLRHPCRGDGGPRSNSAVDGLRPTRRAPAILRSILPLPAPDGRSSVRFLYASWPPARWWLALCSQLRLWSLSPPPEPKGTSHTRYCWRYWRRSFPGRGLGYYALACSWNFLSYSRS